MATSNLGKLILGGLGIGALVAVFGSSSASAAERPPYTVPIPVPGRPGSTWEDFDEALCQCWLAGERDGVVLVNCTLKRIYPEVPWPAQPNDHLSVTTTWQLAGKRVADFRTAVANGQNPCTVVDPVGPGGEEPDVPEAPDDTITTLDPWLDNGPNSFAVIRGNVGHNPSSMAARMYGIPQGNGGLIDRAIKYVATTGFNLLFVGIPHAANAYGRGRVPSTGLYYSMGEAFRPVNMDPVAALASGEKLRRQIAWRANAQTGVPNVADGSPRAYFKPWYPVANQIAGGFQPAYQSPWDERRNPPANILRALGWPGGVEEMRAAWEAANPSS